MKKTTQNFKVIILFSSIFLFFGCGDVSTNATNDGFVFTSANRVFVSEGVVNVTTVTAINGGETITYAITSLDPRITNDGELFSIDENFGVLVFINAPDFENPEDSDIDNTYLLSVLAIASGGETKVQDITVIVTDVDESPVFNQESYSVVISNTTPIGTVITNISAQDAEGNAITYGIGGEDAQYFKIDSSSGDLSVKSNLQPIVTSDVTSDFFSLTFSVFANDGSLSSSVGVTATILRPGILRFLSTNQISIPKDSTDIITVHAAKINESVTYAITNNNDGAGDDGGLFSIDSIPGSWSSTMHLTLKTLEIVMATTTIN